MFNIKNLTKTASVLAIFGVCAMAAGSSFAETKWAQNHPRREQVNHRLENQNDRITREVQSGDMSAAKAAKLHEADHQIRLEERNMAAQNDGHITRLEQATLNQQENRLSHKIGS